MSKVITTEQGKAIAEDILSKVTAKGYALSSDIRTATDSDVQNLIQKLADDFDSEPTGGATGTSKKYPVQYSEMPDASEEYAGKIVQYVGTTTASGGYSELTGKLEYANGGFYKCVNNNGVYSWEATDLTAQTCRDWSRNHLRQLGSMETLEAASIAANAIVQYTGNTDENYTNGHFYKHVSDGNGGFTWSEVEVQTGSESGSSGGVGKTIEEEGVDYGGLSTYVVEGCEIFNCYEGADANVAARSFSHAEGKKTAALADYSHTEGYQTVVPPFGICGHAEGYKTGAGMYCHAEGSGTIAGVNEYEGRYSHAEGIDTTTAGYGSHAEGFSSETTGYYSHVEGAYTIASNYASHAAGKCNKEMETGASDYASDGDAFVIGNGTPGTWNSQTKKYDFERSNAFRVTYAGETYGLSAFNASGADYAEYFEWADGNPDNEDRVGYFVTLKGRKIVKAKDGDYILGIVSGNPCMIGNSDEDWQGRWEHDEFDRFIKEDVETPVLDYEGKETGEVTHGWKFKANPNYDSSQKYVERKDRQEWDAVGMVGVLSVWDDGRCEVDGYAKVSADGRATRADEYIAGRTYRVVERITDRIVRVILK